MSHLEILYSQFYLAGAVILICFALWVNYAVLNFLIWQTLLRKNKCFGVFLLSILSFTSVLYDRHSYFEYFNPPAEYFKSGISRYISAYNVDMGTLIYGYRSNLDFTGDNHWCVILQFEPEEYESINQNLYERPGLIRENFHGVRSCELSSREVKHGRQYDFTVYIRPTNNNRWLYYKIFFSDERKEILFFFTT